MCVCVCVCMCVFVYVRVLGEGIFTAVSYKLNIDRYTLWRVHKMHAHKHTQASDSGKNRRNRKHTFRHRNPAVLALVFSPSVVIINLEENRKLSV